MTTLRKLPTRRPTTPAVAIATAGSRRRSIMVSCPDPHPSPPALHRCPFAGEGPSPWWARDRNMSLVVAWPFPAVADGPLLWRPPDSNRMKNVRRRRHGSRRSLGHVFHTLHHAAQFEDRQVHRDDQAA